jgi:hypothetical protein
MRASWRLHARVRHAGRHRHQQAAGALQAGPGWTRPDVLQAVYARAQLGRMDEALALLQTALQRDLESREIFNAAVSNAMFASRQYQIALGLVGDAQLLGPFVTAGQGIEGFKPLFAVKADGGRARANGTASPRSYPAGSSGARSTVTPACSCSRS